MSEQLWFEDKLWTLRDHQHRHNGRWAGYSIAVCSVCPPTDPRRDLHSEAYAKRDGKTRWVEVRAGQPVSCSDPVTQKIYRSPMSNSWMNDVNVVAQFAHSGIAYAALLTIDRFHPSWFWYGAGATMLWATLKEFIYDARYETPKQSFKNNLTDFSFYGLGTGLAAVVHFIGLLPKFVR